MTEALNDARPDVRENATQALENLRGITGGFNSWGAVEPVGRNSLDRRGRIITGR